MTQAIAGDVVHSVQVQECGWFGPIPADWSIKPLKIVASLNDEVLAEDTDPDEEIQYVDIGSVNNRGEIETISTMYFGQAPSRARRRVRHGDTIVSTVRTYLRAIARVVDPAPNLIVSTGFAVIRPRGTQPVDADYLGWMLRSAGFVEQVVANSVGVSYPAIAPTRLGDISVPAPPASAQQAIAAFLDRETARIDGLIAEKRRLIELLREKRQAVISHAVTKGLDPNAPRKDSGIEWLGEVPAHWTIKQLRHLRKPGTSITYGIVQAGPHIDDGVPYIRTSDMAGDFLPEEGYLRTSHEIDAAYSRSKVRSGDLVVAIRATVGKTLKVPEYLDGANLTQGTAKISLRNEISKNYLLYVLNSTNSSSGFASMAKGATFKEITLEMLRKFPVPFPPTDEQARVSVLLAEELRPIQTVIQIAQTAIVTLEEHRSALIAAAVTGRIDVCGYGTGTVEAAE